MAKGEFESQKALLKHLPSNTAAAFTHGTFGGDPTRSFLLSPFLRLDGGHPSPSELAKVLKTLRESSVSPAGKFGFPVTTFNGIVPLVNDWTDTWEEWFSRQLWSDITWEQAVAGPDSEFEKVTETFFEKVIPRLLRPLETGGRSIKPTLLHGDLWPGNCQVDSTTGQAVLFDACCCYGHHESEFH